MPKPAAYAVVMVMTDDQETTVVQIVDELNAHIEASTGNRRSFDDGTPFHVLAVDHVPDYLEEIWQERGIGGADNA